MNTNPNTEQNVEENIEEQLPYNKPQLIHHGNITDIVEANLGFGSDGGFPDSADS